MARWRLTDKHYLAVPGTEWEYKETGLSGKQKRMVRQVPQYLDPDDPADWTHRELFAIIVSDGEGSDPRDLVFVGPPTQDMEPLDEAAEAISAKHRAGWANPVEALRSNGEGLLNDLFGQMAAIKTTQQPSTPGGPSMEQFEALQARFEEVLKQNAALQAAAAEPSPRRV